ncbi:MAG TPA: DUF4399 domain-containing protein [Paracoccaceae bacterium]|nr:DUF4399 domain-containing protein [Paracoccaceae bacterium]
MSPKLAASILLAALPAGVALAGDTPAPAEAQVYFLTPIDGVTLASPVTIIFGLSDMGVAPSGTEVEGTGHHHLLLDRPPFDPATEADAPIPTDARHLHFGTGETETVLDLPPGIHTLQLVLGDGAHVPHDPPIVSEQITITIE